MPLLKPIQTNLNQMCLCICSEDKHKMLKFYAYPIICPNVPNIYCDIHV